MARRSRKDLRKRRHQRLRVDLCGSAERPRLSVFRSLKHIYAQLIDDEAGKSLCGVSTLTPSMGEKIKGKPGIEQAKLIGETIGEMAASRNIERVLFDRGGFKYGGRVKALADAARSKGLKF